MELAAPLRGTDYARYFGRRSEEQGEKCPKRPAWRNSL
jgi:hypothetical protein